MDRASAPSGIGAETTYVDHMSDTREILILTRLMAAIMLAEFVSHSFATIQPVHDLAGLALVAVVLHWVRAKARDGSR